MPAWFQRLNWSQKFLGVIAVVFAVLMLLNPEFIALGLLGDAAFFDLFVLLISLKFQMVGDQVRRCAVGVYSKTMRWFVSPRLSYLLILSICAAIATAASSIQKWAHRLLS